MRFVRRIVKENIKNMRIYDDTIYKVLK